MRDKALKKMQLAHHYHTSCHDTFERTLSTIRNVSIYETNLWNDIMGRTCLRNLRKKGILLDLGCGTGKIISFYYKDVSYVVAFDISPKNLMIFRLIADIHKVKAYLICADAHHSPFRGDIFDVVLCANVIEHLGEPEKCIAEIFRTIKKDGCAIFAVPNLWDRYPPRLVRDGYKYLQRVFPKILTKTMYDEHLHKYPPSRWIDLIEKARLRIIYTRADRVIPSPFTFFENPCLEKLEPELCDNPFSSRKFNDNRLISKINETLSKGCLFKYLGSCFFVACQKP